MTFHWARSCSKRKLWFCQASGGDKHHNEVDTKLFHLVGLISIPLHNLSLEFLAWIQCTVGEICHLSSAVSSGITVFFQLLFCYLVVWHQNFFVFIWNLWHFFNDAIFSFRDCILEITLVNFPQHLLDSYIFTFILHLKVMFFYAPIFCLKSSYPVTSNCIWFFIQYGSNNTVSKYSSISIWSILLTWNDLQ